MLDREYRVKYITSKNSFLYLSDKDLKLLEPDYLIRVSYGVCKTAYFSLGPPLNSLKEGELALSSTLAKELGIVKNDVVSVSSTTRIYSVSKLNIVASSKDDYEILSILADDVQSNLLSQVRIVHNGQRLVIWISHSLHVVVDVDGVLPISPGRLEPMTEVSVVQPNLHRPPDPVQKRPSITPSNSILGKYDGLKAVFRLLPVEDLHNDSELFRQPFNIFVSRRDLPQCPDTISTPVLLQLRPICLDVDQPPTAIVVRVIALEDLYDDFKPTNFDTAYVPMCIFRHFHTKTGCKAVIGPLKEISKPVLEVQISTERRHFGKADELVRNYIINNLQESAVLLNPNVLLTESNGCSFKLKFESAYIVVDRGFMRSCKFTLSEDELNADEEGTSEVSTGPNLNLECSNYSRIIEGAVKSAGMRLERMQSCHSNVLLVGGKGTGKSSLAQHTAQVLTKRPSRIYTETLHCKKLKGKHADSLLKVVNAAFVRLVYYQPSLVVLDDLDVICEKVIEGDVPTQENLHFNRISEILAETLEHYVRNNRISILATCESTSKLNERVFSSRGKHLFKSIYTCDNLNKTDRIELLKYFIKTKEADDAEVDYETIGNKTEGFVVQDLIDFADKVLFEVYKDDASAENIKITTKHCEEALKNSVSLSMRNVQLHTVGERDFSDVGGLDEVKKILVECMLWPTKHSAIFDHSPLRLQSGVLLYGPPGTGKTILAAAAAKQCGLRLISVKGPELLSKYIGASEQSVRDVFQKAQSAKPCILFFDEFDSLAPRRGHDNTGVTDRVVNQFLTQLDGVESLSGVCVLAATSRPDLLDPALLRPGRLDRQILCPMPDKESRLAILKALSKSMPLSKDVDLSKIADETTGYSGADLQAVLYTAQLSSVEHILNSTDNKVKTDECPVTQRHLVAAVCSTRPSLTREEKLKYETIYSKFQGKGDLLDLRAGKQKTTLA